MFNKLFDLIEHGSEWTVMKNVIESTEQLLEHFEDDRMKEGSYPAAIDALCEILQSYKQKHLNNIPEICIKR